MMDGWMTQNLNNSLRPVVLIVWPTNPSVPLRCFQKMDEVKAACEIACFTVLTFSVMMEKRMLG